MNGSISRRLKDYAALGRVSNLPTVFTNVLVGCVAATQETGLMWGRVAGAFIGITGIYMGGMVMNDVVDADHDKVHRSRRPIPRGGISLQEGRWLALAAFTLGLSVLATMSWRALAWGGVLVSAVVAYNLWHKQYAWSVGLMGWCRALVYVVAAAAAGGAVLGQSDHVKMLWVMAGMLGLYVVGLSLLARWENKRANSGWIVAMGLAAICLLDGVFLILLGHGALSWVAVGCWALTLALQRVVSGT